MIDIRHATPDDVGLPTFDFTKASAINTCPTWGIIRYEKHLTVPRPGRAMALEAGSACHEVFAAARIVSLLEGEHHDIAVAFGRRQFGDDRFTQIISRFNSPEPIETRRTAFCLETLDTGPFYDDPTDKRRTRSNLSDSCTAYLQRYNYEAWQPVVDEASQFVGIEVPFDLVVRTASGSVRFMGRCDGIIDNKRFGEIEVHENKTGSRINEPWAMSFHMSHQITGYIVCANFIVAAFREGGITRATVHGLQIPLPRSFEVGGVVTERVSRHEEQITRWVEWLEHTAEILTRYRDDPLSAPKYTHSCNRYFRPCSMIPLCIETRENQEIMLEEEYVEDKWSPLDEKVGD